MHDSAENVEDEHESDDEKNRNANAKDGNMSDKLAIVDARPWINAEANKLKGKGYENVKYYSDNIQLQFMGIINIHVTDEDVADPA